MFGLLCAIRSGNSSHVAGSADMHEDVLIQPHRLDETFSYTIRLARTVAAGLVQSVPERGRR